MSSKSGYTWFFFLTCFIISCSTILLYQVLPISRTTKQYLGYSTDSLLNFTELTSKYGYITEEHSVVTEDGYVLQLFRIVKAKNCHGNKRKTPVILMHGLFQSSDSWVNAGPQAGLAYLISDACYDIWVGNIRGNYYSRKHVTMDPDKDPKFWHFSLHEVGIYDIPATIDYVLNHTETKRVNYIGFSQGAAIFFIMCSERPEFCAKTNLSIMLAPASQLFHTESSSFRKMTSLCVLYGKLLSTSGAVEIVPKGGLFHEFTMFVCNILHSTSICEIIKDTFDGVHPGSITSATLSAATGHIPAGTSSFLMTWYDQSLNREGFKKLDYGESVNLEMYGSVNPPVYNLGAVTVPVMVMNAKNDRIVHRKDVEWLKERLPNVVESTTVPDLQWSHLDFNYSKDIRVKVFGKIDSYLNMYSENYTEVFL